MPVFGLQITKDHGQWQWGMGLGDDPREGDEEVKAGANSAENRGLREFSRNRISGRTDGLNRGSRDPA